MQGIPPVKETDAEDVAWGLQTADALWKRGERGDALVWLRRAAQAAGDSNDDDRALELARFAAELTEWMTVHEPEALPATSKPPSVAPVVSAANPLPIPPPPAFLGPIPTDLTPSAPPAAPGPAKLSKPPLPRPNLSKPPVPRGASAPPAPQPVAEVSRPPEPSIGSFPPPEAFPAPEDARPKPPAPSPPSQPTQQTAQPVFPDQPEEPEEPQTTSVPPAERVHAGMFNPWAENQPPSQPEAPAAPPVNVPARFAEEEDEVITSASLAALRKSTAPSRPPAGNPSERPEPPKARAPSEPPVRIQPSAAPKPPPLPPRAKKPAPPEAAPPAPPEPPAPIEPPTRPYDAVSEPPPPAPPTPPPPSPTQVNVPVRSPSDRVTRTDDAEVEEESDPRMDLTPVVGVPSVRPTAPSQRPLEPSRPEPAELAPPPAPAPAPALDLEDVDAFSDLPDDAREAFAAAATVSKLAEGEEVSHFALAYVLEGALDVAATMVDAPASRLPKGAVLRARGTTEDGVPMRLICAGGDAVVATWSDVAVEEAFRTIPWVEEDLRAAADKVQTLVGITIGPLGERLDASIREQIVGRLVMRPLGSGELVVEQGAPVPGLFLIGVGEIELLEGDAVAGTLGSGEFLFAGEVLHAGAAPRTARAGKGGALVLFGDRNIAQELMVTCPPLLEVFAGM